MITQQQSTLENWKHIIPSDNITGGQAWEHTLKTTFKGAEHVNSSRSTNNRQSPLFFLHFLPTEGASTTRPFANCSMDFIMDLPLVKGHNSILMIVDQGLTKGTILIPCSKMITTKQTVQLLLENLYKQFGLLDKIISDRGPQFASRTFVELLKLLGIKSSLSTAYHLQTNGTTEWVNQEIEAYLAIYCVSPRRMANGPTHSGIHP